MMPKHHFCRKIGREASCQYNIWLQHQVGDPELSVWPPVKAATLELRRPSGEAPPALQDISRGGMRCSGGEPTHQVRVPDSPLVVGRAWEGKWM